MIVSLLSPTAYTKRLLSSMRRDQNPARYYLSGSGLPRPSKELCWVSEMSLYIRFHVFYPDPANICNLTMPP